MTPAEVPNWLRSGENVDQPGPKVYIFAPQMQNSEECDIHRAKFMNMLLVGQTVVGSLLLYLGKERWKVTSSNGG